MNDITSSALLAVGLVALLIVGAKIIFPAQSSSSQNETPQAGPTPTPQPNSTWSQTMNETRDEWIKTTKSSQAVASLLNLAGFLSIIGGIALAVMADAGGAMFVMSGILGGVGCFAAACVLNHLRQLVLAQLGKTPTQ